MPKRLITYALPVYNEAGSLDRLFQALTEATDGLKERYDLEFLFVNDGSQDSSLAALYALQARDPRITVINFARNFGHQVAVTAALDHASGDAVIIMDTDLQDPPAVSLDLIRMWEQGYDVAYAQRRTRKDSVFKRLTAKAFYWVLERLADVEIPRDTGDFRLVDRRVVDALGTMRERDRFLRGLVSWVGFRQIAVPFDRDERFAGTTGYPLRKMIKFAADGILSFSTLPLKFITRIGLAFSLLSGVGILYALLTKLVTPSVAVPGWAFLAIAIFALGGVQFLMLGVLGSYLGRVYSQVQGRPLYIVESVREAKHLGTQARSGETEVPDAADGDAAAADAS